MQSVFILLAVAMLAVIKIKMCQSIGQEDTLPKRNENQPNNVAVALDSYHDVTKRDEDEPEITRHGKKCDPRAKNGQNKCGYHGTDVSYVRKIENSLSCTVNADTGEQEYCCADPCVYHAPDFWRGGYWWCRITDKGLGHKWEYCTKGVPHYNRL